MLTVYCDESGTHPESAAVVVACYVSQVRAWERFAKDWPTLLNSAGIEVLHRNKLESFTGEFKSWNNGSRVVFLKEAHRIIKRNTIRGFAYAVVKADFERVMPTVIKDALGIYGWCVQDCMVAVANWAVRTGRREPINYVLEKGAIGIGGARRLFEQVEKTPRLQKRCLLGTWAFAGKDIVQLQAPDTLAYEMYRYVSDNVIKAKKTLREAARDLIRACDRTNYWDEVRLRKYLNSLLISQLTL